MSDKRRTFAVIDGNSLMHRAYHAVPQTMNAPDGRPTNAIFGFLNMFLKMIDAFNPDGVVVAFDKGMCRFCSLRAGKATISWEPWRAWVRRPAATCCW